MRLDNFASDGQPKSCAFLVALPRHAKELTKNIGLKFGRNADACIGNGELDGAIGGFCR